MGLKKDSKGKSLYARIGSSMTKIAIVTVNYNGKEDTLELLQSMGKLKIENCELKIIVVDNGSSDGSVAEINEKYPDVDILQNGANEGFSGGYNRGMIYGYIWGADYVLIINNDALIKDPNLLTSMAQVFKSDERIGLISPKIYFAKGFEFHKDRYKDDELGKVIWYGGGKFDWNNLHSIHRGMDEVDNGKYDEAEETGLITGCCLMIKREVLEKVTESISKGFFDDDLFLYMEDNDFAVRARKKGFKTYYDGQVAIYHKASQSAGIGSEITDFFHTRNRLVLGFRYSSFRTKFALIREALKFLMFGRKAQKMGVWDFLMGKRGSSSRYIKEVRKADYQLKLSICIVSYNTADLTKNLLESIFKAGSGFTHKAMEVIVLDNGSKDRCKEVIKEFLPKIKYLQNEVNEGFTKGYNKAISYSKGQYVLMLNSDIEVLEGSLTQMLLAAQKYGEKAVLGGRLYFPDMSDQDSVFYLPTVSGAFKEYFLAQKGSYFMYLPKGEDPVRVEGLVMACFLIPEKVINKVGLLDEGTFIFFEDIEYCRRLKKAGIPLYFVPLAKFIHHHGGSTKRLKSGEAYKLLTKGSRHYHGSFYYSMLSSVLWLGQKIGRVQTPVAR